jgi:mannose-6-phosphate isomerase
MNYTETRPWGQFENLLDTDYCKVKRITVNPQQRLSYQYHYKREEVWTVVSGTGAVTINNLRTQVSKGSVVQIPIEAKHRIENTSEDEDLIFIEVQNGTYFGEDDIVRLKDDYKRN